MRSLTKVFPAREWAGSSIVAVDRLNLDVNDGELLTLVGPSGCGKTTLLRLIAGLEVATRGTITIAGEDQRNVPSPQRDVAMVFQNLALYPHLSARENLAFGLKLRNASPAEIETRVGEMAARLGLTDCLARRPAELSGGQRQRAALGRALIRRPKVLLLDEPFANLDAPLRRDLRRELRRLHTELRLTTVLVTHDQAEALALGHRVAVLHSGRLEQIGTPDELRTRPGNDFVRTFLDEHAL